MFADCRTRILLMLLMLLMLLSRSCGGGSINKMEGKSLCKLISETHFHIYEPENKISSIHSLKVDEHFTARRQKANIFAAALQCALKFNDPHDNFYIMTQGVGSSHGVSYFMVNFPVNDDE